MFNKVAEKTKKNDKLHSDKTEEFLGIYFPSFGLLVISKPKLSYLNNCMNNNQKLSA